MGKENKNKNKKKPKNPSPYPLALAMLQINPKQIIDLRVRAKTIKLREENIGENLCDRLLRSQAKVLKQNTKYTNHERKLIKWTLLK